MMAGLAVRAVYSGQIEADELRATLLTLFGRLPRERSALRIFSNCYTPTPAPACNTDGVVGLQPAARPSALKASVPTITEMPVPAATGPAASVLAAVVSAACRRVILYLHSHCTVFFSPAT